MRLSQLQSSFTQHMFDLYERIENPDEDFADMFAPSKVPLTEQLSIYRTHVVNTLSGVVEETFPMVNALVGEEFLHTMAMHFVMKNPPSEACLNHYGSDFSAFIATYEAAVKLPYLPDCARLDWAMNKAYYALKTMPLTTDDLSTIDPKRYEDVMFSISPNIQLVESDYPLHQIYEFCAEQSGKDLSIDGMADYLMVARINHKSQIIKLSAAEHALLMQIQSGYSLGQGIEKSFAIDPQFDFNAFIQNMLALEAFDGFTYS